VITFNVVKEQHGWAVRMGGRMTTPFWSRDLAVREANCLAQSIRRHGECTEVIVHEPDFSHAPTARGAAVVAGRLATLGPLDGSVVI